MHSAFKIAGALTAGVLGGWLLRRARQPAPRVARSNERRPKIVVAGAGFAGISVIQRLKTDLPHGAADVVLIDQHNYHLFTPLLYQVATGAVDSTNLTFSLRRLVAAAGFRFVHAEISGINPIDRTLTTSAGQIDYDYLVIGIGSQTNYFGMDEVERRSFGLKTVPEAVELRKQIIRNFERAAQLDNQEEQRSLLTFIVVGGGATGVELLGSIQDLIQNSLLRYYPEIAPGIPKVMLLEAGESLLPGINPRISDLALKRFEELGIDVRLRTMVSGVRDGSVIVRDGDPITGDVVVWTAGIRPHPVAAGLAIEKSRDGRLVVDEHLRVPAFPEIFALGDLSASVDPCTGEVLPPNAAVAVQEGEVTGKNLANLMFGSPLEPFNYKPMGELIALGRLRAAAELGPFVFDGLPAWLVWRVVYLTMLMGVKNRAGLIIDWFASLFAYREIVDTDRIGS